MDGNDGYGENDCPQVEKVVCETEFRPTCTVKLEKDCKNVTRCSSLSLSQLHAIFPPSYVDLSLLRRPACEVSEKMECVENTVSQCSFETRLGSTGEEEQVEVG